jgi:hypothetical protein
MKNWQAKVHIGGGPSERKWGIIAATVGQSAVILWDYYFKGRS